jgi:hypothetical protein
MTLKIVITRRVKAMNKKSIPALLTLSITLSADSLVLVSLLWSILKAGGSGEALGMFLFISSLIPFFLQRFSNSFKDRIAKDPAGSFKAVRIAAILSSVLLYVGSSTMGLTGLYVASCVFGIIFFFTSQCLETLLSNQVLEKRVSANDASRILQTALQMGAFAGGTASGFLMEWGGLHSVSVALAICFGIGTLAISQIQALKLDILSESSSAQKTRSVYSTLGLACAFLMIGIVLVQVSAFNVLVPYMAHKERAWSAADYGIIDAFAGLGAFVAAVALGNRFRFLHIMWVAALGLALSNLGLGGSLSVTAATAAAFGGGFFSNLIRVKQREILFSSVESSHQAVDWAGTLAMGSLFFRAVTPLVFGFALSSSSASQCFSILAAVVLVGATSLWALQTYRGRGSLKVAFEKLN